MSQTRRALVAGEGSFIAADATVEGMVEFGKGCVVHPRATIIARAGGGGGRIVFGDACVVEENARLEFQGEGEARIGSNNVFMVASHVTLSPGEAVGDWNTFAPRSKCAVRVASHCSIGAGTAVDAGHSYFTSPEGRAGTGAGDGDGDGDTTARLPDYTVVHGAASSIRAWDGSGAAQEHEVRASATAFLREILPK